MNLKDVKPIDTTEIINKARQLYRAHCASINHIPIEFIGNRSDIIALDYCIYEQLGFPEEDYLYASFLWGDFIRKHTSLHWGLMDNSQHVLYNDECGLHVMIPHARVIESMLTPVPQFEKFTYLTEKTVWELSLFSYVELIPGSLSLLIDASDDGFRSSAISTFKEIGERLKKETA